MVAFFYEHHGTGARKQGNRMKTEPKKARRQSKQGMVFDCTIPETPQNAFIALFAPIRDESWPNVPCSYLFSVDGEKDSDHQHHI